MKHIIGGIYTYSKENNLLNSSRKNIAIIIVLTELQCFVFHTEFIKLYMPCNILSNELINDFIEKKYNKKFFLTTLDMLKNSFFEDGYLGKISDKNLRKIKNNIL